MDQQAFLQTIHDKATELRMNPLLLLSGIEGLYSFRDVRLNALNFEFLDNLILTIFALRIGDQFHTIAEENLTSPSQKVREAATRELAEMDHDAIDRSANHYLKSFANMLQGKSAVRNYHEKALEVAAIEIKKEQEKYQSDSIGNIVMAICHTNLREEVNLSAIFAQ